MRAKSWMGLEFEVMVGNLEQEKCGNIRANYLSTMPQKI